VLKTQICVTCPLLCVKILNRINCRQSSTTCLLSLILCILIVMYALFCIFCFHRANWHSSATLTEVFPCFFISCKANARVQLAKTGHGPHSSQLVNCVVLYTVCVYMCTVLYYCHRVATQLQLTNISVYLYLNSAGQRPQN